jgi:hypothetical protein
MFAVTAVERSLASIGVRTPPKKTAYIENTYFEPEGLEVRAFYDNGEAESVTGYTYDKTEKLTVGDSRVTITYAEKGVTKTASVSITVAARKLAGITVATPPTKLLYSENALFDPTGLALTATYDNGETAVITEYSIDKTGALSLTDTAVTISYREGGITKTAIVNITVTARILTGLTLTTAPNKTAYAERTYFDPTGLVLTASYNNGDTAVVTGYSYDLDGLLEIGDNVVIIAYTEGEATFSVEVGIEVAARSLTAIEITGAPNKTPQFTN